MQSVLFAAILQPYAHQEIFARGFTACITVFFFPSLPERQLSQASSAIVASSCMHRNPQKEPLFISHIPKSPF